MRLSKEAIDNPGAGMGVGYKTKQAYCAKVRIKRTSQHRFFFSFSDVKTNKI